MTHIGDAILSAPNLIKRHSCWYLRVRVPTDLAPSLGSHLTRSLRTRDYQTGRRRALLAAATLSEEWERVRARMQLDENPKPIEAMTSADFIELGGDKIFAIGDQASPEGRQSQKNKMMLRLFVPIFLFLLLMCPGTAGANFSYEDPPDDPDDAHWSCSMREWGQKLHDNVPVPFAIRVGRVMCLFGEITKNGAKEAIAILQTENINKIIVWSPGGDADAGLDLAFEIYKRDINLYVYMACNSACANYLFLAAKKKYVVGKSVVVWHGGPAWPEKFDLSLPEKGIEFEKRIWEKQKKFYDLVGVDVWLPYSIPPCNLEKMPELKEEAESGKNIAFTYDKASLEELFGVTGIMRMGDLPYRPNMSTEPQKYIYSALETGHFYLFHKCD